MSLFDYQVSQKLEAQDVPFYALIMAALRRADSDNVRKLRSVFPDVWRELAARYHAPGGLLPGEASQPAEVAERPGFGGFAVCASCKRSLTTDEERAGARCEDCR